LLPDAVGEVCYASCRLHTRVEPTHVKKPLLSFASTAYREAEALPLFIATNRNMIRSFAMPKTINHLAAAFAL
jgi:hypothetical protein